MRSKLGTSCLSLINRKQLRELKEGNEMKLIFENDSSDYDAKN
jgi:hypothetical protein